MLLAGSGLVPWAGCINSAPPPQRVPVPATSNPDAARERDYVKPMPADEWRDPRDPGRPVTGQQPAEPHP
jgi:hypothetical protein